MWKTITMSKLMSMIIITLHSKRMSVTLHKDIRLTHYHCVKKLCESKFILIRDM